MSRFKDLHGALWDELERQGAVNVDVVRLAQAAVLALGEAPPGLPREPYQRCINGACDG